MKLKVRGLVFVGFAAAVFAQSALAANPTYSGTKANDEKTVTSKWYVDNKFDGQVGYVMTQGATLGSVDFKQMSDTADGVIDPDNVNSGSNILVTGKAVAEAINGLDASLNINGDINLHTQKVPVYAQNHEGDSDYITGWKIVVPSEAVTTDSSQIVNTNSALAGEEVLQKNKLATAGAVYDYAEATANKLPYNTDSSTETITLNSDNNTKFPTAQNVYEFVTKENKAWQPKVVSDDDDTPPSARTIYVGRYEPADDNTPASATWDELTTGTYVTNTSSTSGVYTIDIPTSMLADTATEIGTDGGAQGSLPTGLATAEGVRDYAVRSAWGSGNGGKTLVTTSDGNVTVSNVPAIPEPTGCDSANVHCALVTSYVNNAITLEWTVMAQ